MHNYTPRRFFNHRAGVQYIEMPKVASNSIQQALRHDVKPHRPRSKLVFTFIRHPLARLVSAYVEKIQTGKVKYLVGATMAKDLPPSITLDAFIDFLLNFSSHKKYGAEQINNHFCPQSWILEHEVDIDFIGQLESIDEDWQILVKRGLPFLSHKHPTEGIQHWSEMLTSDMEDRARHFYQDDFERWAGWWD